MYPTPGPKTSSDYLHRRVRPYTGTPSPARLSAWGLTPHDQEMASDPAYSNVAPGQKGAPASVLRADIARKYDPQSWTNATSTQGERNSVVSNRVSGLPAQYASRVRQDPYSPLAGNATAYGVLNANDAAVQAQRANDNANYVDSFQAHRQRVNQGLADRAGAAGLSVEDMQRQEAAASAGQARWQNNRERMYSPPSRVAKPNMQASMHLSRYGVPMALPSDPNTQASWLRSMAAMGSPAAYGMNQQMVDESGKRDRAMLAESGLTQRAKIEQEGAPKALSPEEQLKMFAMSQGMNPMTVANEMRQKRIDSLAAMGYTPEQIKADPSVQQAYDYGMTTAARQYDAARTIPGMGTYFPELPAQPAPQATPPTAPRSPVDVNKVVPDRQPASKSQLESIIRDNPDVTPEMLEATLYANNLQMPPTETLAYEFRDDPVISGWLNKHNARYKIVPPSEYRKSRGPSQDSMMPGSQVW